MGATCAAAAGRRAVLRGSGLGAVVAGIRSPLRERWVLASLAFVAVSSVFCGVASFDAPSFSVGLLSATVTALGMTGLFFVPAAASRELPDVVRRRSRRTPGEAGAADPDPGPQ
ncbi:hypothetical protein HY68_35850 [Streptomyces sp. AcH 505]|uniref:hypothetical protein n=1 Tax=Streptomyces sp. AcH 505 TaxID=352211 RepID=UPI000591ACE2|nr:hypothetical protein HY68_35850 [Streptomyces sp. AcH 505]